MGHSNTPGGRTLDVYSHVVLADDDEWRSPGARPVRADHEEA